MKLVLVVCTLALAVLSLTPARAISVPAASGLLIDGYVNDGFKAAGELKREWPALGLVTATLLEEGDGLARHRARLIVSTGGGNRVLLDQEYAYATLVSLEDVDHDGTLDVVVRAGNGGDCVNCSWMEAKSIATDRVSDLVPPGKYQDLVDIDHDGVAEAIAIDPRWEYYEGLCRTCSPRIERIFRRKGGAWVEASREFSAFYHGRVRALEEDLSRAAKASPGEWDDQQLGTLLSIMLYRRQLGEDAEAWKHFEQQMLQWRDGMSPQESEAQARITGLISALKRDLKL
jgi:hypothetical protein